MRELPLPRITDGSKNLNHRKNNLRTPWSPRRLSDGLPRGPRRAPSGGRAPGLHVAADQTGAGVAAIM